MNLPEDSVTIERELAAVDSALSAGAALDDDPVARELQELALALRAEAPPPDAGFAAQLRARVEQGFPRASRARPRMPARRMLLGVAAVAAPLLLIAVVVLAGGGSENGVHTLSDSGAGGGGSVEQAGGAADASVQPTPSKRGFVPDRTTRRIERSFSLELDVARDDMTRVADDVATTTARHGGFVLDSSVNTGEDGGGGDFSLRIPADRLRPALRDLAGLAPVIRQSQEGRDVTRQHVTASDRLQSARAERRSLLRRLEAAATDAEAEALRRRLDLVSAEINGLRARLRDLHLRTDYAVVTVSLLQADEADGGSAIGGSFDDALGDAGDLLVGFAGMSIRVLALALPLSLVVLVAWPVARSLRRRRRESALGSA